MGARLGAIVSEGVEARCGGPDSRWSEARGLEMCGPHLDGRRGGHANGLKGLRREV